VSRRIEIINRIKSNIIIDKNNCWNWQGSNSGIGVGAGRGYGRISLDGHTSAVHRVMFITVHGFVPNKKQIDHICNNRLCCNPEHLQVVTAKKNIKLMYKRKNDKSKS
jgi:hypothetical protein